VQRPYEPSDYRNIAYFNALPSYANPFAPSGFTQRSFDTRQRTADRPAAFPKVSSCPTRLASAIVFRSRVETWLEESDNHYPVLRFAHSTITIAGRPLEWQTVGASRSVRGGINLYNP
jgi:hypothetical protein